MSIAALLRNSVPRSFPGRLAFIAWVLCIPTFIIRALSLHNNPWDSHDRFIATLFALTTLAGVLRALYLTRTAS